VVKGLIQSVIVSPTQKAMAVPSLPKAINAALSHDAAGVIGVSAPNAFYITLDKNAALDKKYTAIGRVIAGASSLAAIKKADEVRSIRITRVGQAARDFKTDDESFKKLIAAATKKK
jgi:cyclophilin family peptidyl-prolyl cis-trans isomerase